MSRKLSVPFSLYYFLWVSVGVGLCRMLNHLISFLKFQQAVDQRFIIISNCNFYFLYVMLLSVSVLCLC